MARGDLVPDRILITLISDAVDRNLDHDVFILDGFPQTLAQGIGDTHQVARQIDGRLTR